jgi:hypothetical protein
VFPTYTWEPVTGADWYALSVYDLVTRQNEYSTAVYASVCTATLCSFRSTEAQAALPNGRALGWYVAAVDAAGTGPWGGGKAFYVFAPPPAPTLITPSGDITTQTPIYRWERKPDSEWVYYLIVLDGYANVVFQQIIINPSGACDINECQVGQSASLYYWYYSWFLAAGNPAGWGPYSMLSFRTVWNPSAASTFEP